MRMGTGTRAASPPSPGTHAAGQVCQEVVLGGTLLSAVPAACPLLGPAQEHCGLSFPEQATRLGTLYPLSIS